MRIVSQGLTWLAFFLHARTTRQSCKFFRGTRDIRFDCRITCSHTATNLRTKVCAYILAQFRIRLRPVRFYLARKKKGVFFTSSSHGRCHAVGVFLLTTQKAIYYFASPAFLFILQQTYSHSTSAIILFDDAPNASPLAIRIPFVAVLFIISIRATRLYFAHFFSPKKKKIKELLREKMRARVERGKYIAKRCGIFFAAII